jgi:ABC-type iron transport system FetAB permease component
MRIARVALWYAAIDALLMLFFVPLPWSATSRERGSWLFLAAMVIASAMAAILITRRRRSGWALTIGLGLLTLSDLVTSDFVHGDRAAFMDPGAAVPLSFIIAGSVNLAWLIAFACCLRVRAWPAPQAAGSL